MRSSTASAHLPTRCPVTAGRSSRVCVCNLSPVPRYGYRVGMPLRGRWREALNTDSAYYGGTGEWNLGEVKAEAAPWHDEPFSAELTLPPLGVVWLVPAAVP